MNNCKRSIPDAVRNSVEDRSNTRQFNPLHLCQYMILGEDVFCPASASTPTLSPGTYEIVLTQDDKPAFKRVNVVADAYLNFTDSQLSEIMGEVDFFWGQEAVYKEYGFTHRRGIMLYGRPGGGKTVLMSMISHDFIEKYQGVAILGNSVNPYLLRQAVTALREIEPLRKVVVLIEDIDAYASRCGEENLLEFLDGERSMDHLLVLATTNYPERLDPRLTARPRRFDKVILVNNPTSDMRRVYFSEKLGLKDSAEVEEYVKRTPDFTFAMMAELVISVKCLNADFEKSLSRIKDLNNSKKSSEDYAAHESAGFGFPIDVSKDVGDCYAKY